VTGRTLIVAATVVLLTAEANAQAWITDSKSGCHAWNQNPEPGETVAWDGACQNGFAQGHGRLSFYRNGNVGTTLEGEFHDGKLEGYGVVRSADGKVYMGNFLNGVPSGGGVFVTDDGITLGGDWVNGCARDDKHVAAIGTPITDCPHPAVAKFGG